MKVKHCIATLSGHTGTIWCLLQMENKNVLSGSSDKTIKMWSTNNFNCLVTINESDVIRSLCELDNGDVVSSTGKIWDFKVKNPKNISTLSGDTESIRCLAKLKNGDLISCSSDKKLKVWDMKKKKNSTLEGHTDSVRCLIVLKTGEVLSGSRDNTLKLWNIKSKKCIDTLTGHSDWVSCVIELKTGEVISGSEDHSIKIWKKVL
jgi:WD40 repeat protein